MRFKDLKLANKIYVLFALAVPVMCAVFGGLYWKSSENLYQERYTKVQSQVETAWSLVNHFAEQAKAGTLSHDQAQQLAMAAVKNLRYGGQEYFWINDTMPRMVMHPIKPSLDGKDLSGFADPNGVKLFVEMVKETRSSEGGFVHYQWAKPGSEKPVDKVSYVKRIPDWNWIIGSGLYMDDVAKETRVMLYGAIGIIAGTIFFSTLIVIWFTHGLSGPIHQVVSMLQELSKGHIGQRLNLNRKDEIGLMASTMDTFADSLELEVVDTLQKLAAGDLTFEIHPHDDQDVIRGALKQMEVDLNSMMSEIQRSGEQIAAGAEQISDASQSLSQGATESASSLEEIAASINELASQTDHNAHNARQAATLSSEASSAAVRGNNSMEQMVKAMAEINEAGQNISKIIKVIDEIAFQTNLLALNAAVEAARAGQHGKGFAVVAEEVRNLAARSAKAASETADLIEGSVSKAENGAEIAEQTAEALSEIVNRSSKVNDLIAEISAASSEQAQGISQINIGISQIDDVTQQNTANAEQGAASAEELASQAENLLNMLHRFQLKTVASNTSRARSATRTAASATRKSPRQLGW
ncbi:MAG: cache domain-containing protein [Desulfuromonadaceae bacterium]|nr:cache domain-containing protein [Desulfuromonadaceae bacterium]